MLLTPFIADFTPYTLFVRKIQGRLKTFGHWCSIFALILFIFWYLGTNNINNMYLRIAGLNKFKTPLAFKIFLELKLMLEICVKNTIYLVAFAVKF